MQSKVKTYLLQSLLLIITILTTTAAGTEWMTGKSLFDTNSLWTNFKQGFYFSIPFLGILTVHEFGHYITARIYKVRVTLPYYIPLYIPGLMAIGTLGAFIRIKSFLKTRRQVFDIGVAGPLAGFIAALIILFYGFTHLPPVEYIYKVHAQYEKYGKDYAKYVYTPQFLKEETIEQAKKENISLSRQDTTEFTSLSMGKNLLFLFFEKYVVKDKSLIPNKYEMFHYPFLLAGYLALFFTALNLIPIGQLDGGHILYGLLGYKNHTRISTGLFVVFVFLAGIGIFRDNIVFGILALFNIYGSDPAANAFSSNEHMVIFSIIYLYFLYIIFSRLTDSMLTNVMVAVVVFSIQFFIEFLFPEIKGFSGWFAFAFLIGRFLGVKHPPALVEQPLDTKRKIIGWLSLVIFIISFTPQLFQFEQIK